MATHRVRVVLTAEVEVEIDVEAGERDDPTDLTQEEERRAKALAPSWPDWQVDWTRTDVVS